MPNHVENELTVTGDEAALLALVQAIDGDGPFDCDKIIPYPERFKTLDKAAKDFDEKHGANAVGGPRDGFNSGGYEWCKKNWGTKWGVYDARLHRDGTTAQFYFRSAWTPPLPVIRKAAEKFPGLTFELNYYE